MSPFIVQGESLYTLLTIKHSNMEKLFSRNAVRVISHNIDNLQNVPCQIFRDFFSKN